MARTLSDSLIVAVLEAATRLTGARGPIAGSAAAHAQHKEQGAVATPPAGEGTGATAVAAPPTADGGGAAAGGADMSGASSASGGSGASGGEHDTRTAQEIAADFKTIYAQIEELVRASAEQEAKTVGFGRG